MDVSRKASALSNLKAFYIYKKNQDGKLVLSYHNREANFTTPITEQQRVRLNLDTKNVVSSYRHEGIVINIEEDRKKIDAKNPVYDKMDMGDYEFTYHPEFWKNINLPPETKFYKKSVAELESIYGVSLETQYQAVNK